MKRMGLLFMTIQSLIYADSLVLVNDSNVRLNAVIEDANGNILQETVIDSQDSSTWSLDSFFGFGSQEGPAPEVPYTVYWYCMNGNLYGTCQDVPSDSTVMAQSCLGGQECNPNQ